MSGWSEIIKTNRFFLLEWLDVFALIDRSTLDEIFDDNGHGVNTPGKCSPDGVFREYKYTREIAAAVVKHLGYRGFDAALVTPEEYDVSSERAPSA